MIIRQFLLWAQTAPPGERAEAAGALARAYLYSDLKPEDRWEAETAMTALLDDPSPLVRRALAEAFANAREAPRHLVVALANDQSDIAALVLARSPVLPDADLVDCAALGGEIVQTAVALRPRVSVAVSAALAEIASAVSLTALAGNAGAAIADSAFARMVERHGGSPELREALLARPDLPLPIRQSIAVAVSESLSTFVLGCGWLSPERTERIVREAREKTTLALSSAAEREDVSRLVSHLRRTGQLTPALILRALLSGGMAFAEAAFADLSGLAPARVAGLLRDRRGAGFAPLYRKAGLPAGLKPAFDGALSALREHGEGETAADGAQLSRLMIERALTACRDLSPEEAGKLMALLRRFESEAARDEARHIAGALADEAALAVVMRHAPHALIGSFGDGEREAA
ncbi:MAG TPA: DUF2336 domain-containing protein [Beijerinckiaceae bacterium]|jgi:uncharacterized protein (DUF2336 family)